MSIDKQRISWPGWEVVKLIGRGSFGEVYEIERNIFGEIEKAALKVITIPQNASDIDEMYSDGYDEESITSTFQNHLKSIVAEYSMMRKMNGCANIVSCDDVRYIQHDDGIGWDIFIKMELLTPVTKVMLQIVSEDTVIKLAKDICTALELCRRHGIIHRDIKPQNIFVSAYGDYKLGDFGIAKTVEKTMGGTKIGTYKYMAPEVYNNQPYGSAADIYSLGLVLYWLLNERRMPFLPLPPDKLSMAMDEHARTRRLTGETFAEPKHGSKELKVIVMKACAYNVEDRYSSAAEMLADLNRIGARNNQAFYSLGWEPDCSEDNEETVGIFTQEELLTPRDGQKEKITVRLPDDAINEQGFDTIQEHLEADKTRRRTSVQPVRKSVLQISLVVASLIMVLVVLIPVFWKDNWTRSQNPKTIVFQNGPIYRIGEDNQYETGVVVADIQKQVQGIDKFESVIITSPNGDSAVFSTGYLSYVKNAPVLYVSEEETQPTLNYVRENLREGGTVYLLGSTYIHADLLASVLPECNVRLLRGDTRYSTNVAVLREAGCRKEEILICHTDNDAAGISAAATSKPVMLVGDKLTEEQITFLHENCEEIIIIGEDVANNILLITQLNEIDPNLEWIEGTDANTISVNVANRFFEGSDAVVVVYGTDYLRGLSSGMMGYLLDAPILFAEEGNDQHVYDYADRLGIEQAVVFDVSITEGTE